MIFLGNGDHSKRECEQLHQDLDDALCLLGGSQQPCHCSDVNCPCDPDKEFAEVVAAANKIYEKLTGIVLT